MQQEETTFWHKLPRPFQILAPMEDVTDTVFRRLIGQCARPDVYFTEFTSSDGMFSAGGDKVTHRLEFSEVERPLVAQIWGNKPENYFRAAKELNQRGFDGIDINFGCPVDKIIKRGSCSALIENPSLVKELFLAAREGAGSLPVSIKTRMGFSRTVTENWGEFLLSLRPSLITLHARIAVEQSQKPADWNEVRKLVQLRDRLKSKTLIVGNGDLRSQAEISKRSLESGVDGVMIARGIFENPFIFDRNGRDFKEFDVLDKLSLLERHLDLYERTWRGKKPYRVIKKFFKIYLSNFAGASELRAKAVETESYEEIRSLIAEWKRGSSPKSEANLAFNRLAVRLPNLS